MFRLFLKLFLSAMISLAALTGCVKEPPVQPKVYWPPPPAEPKMEWITSYASEDNFQKSGKQIAAEQFLGKPEVHFFGKPSGITSYGDGVVFVADIDRGEIRAIDFNEKTSKTYSEKAPVAQPLGMAVDSNGNLYVADAKRRMILQFNRNREVVRGFGNAELERPVQVAVDETRGRLYVSDALKHEVLAFDLESTEKLFSFGGRGGGKGQLYVPQGLAVDKQGNIYVAEQLNARVQVFDADGKHLYMFGKRGDRDFDFEAPRGLAFDSQGRLFVADARKSSVMIFMPDGTPLTRLGGGGSVHPLDLVMPTAIYVDVNDRLYICDALMNRRIVIWQMLTPEYLANHPLDEATLKMLEERVRQLKERER